MKAWIQLNKAAILCTVWNSIVKGLQGAFPAQKSPAAAKCSRCSKSGIITTYDFPRLLPFTGLSPRDECPLLDRDALDVSLAKSGGLTGGSGLEPFIT